MFGLVVKRRFRRLIFNMPISSFELVPYRHRSIGLLRKYVITAPSHWSAMSKWRVWIYELFTIISRIFRRTLNTQFSSVLS